MWWALTIGIWIIFAFWCGKIVERKAWMRIAENRENRMEVLSMGVITQYKVRITERRKR